MAESTLLWRLNILFRVSERKLKFSWLTKPVNRSVRDDGLPLCSLFPLNFLGELVLWRLPLGVHPVLARLVLHNLAMTLMMIFRSRINHLLRVPSINSLLPHLLPVLSPHVALAAAALLLAAHQLPSKSGSEQNSQ